MRHIAYWFKPDGKAIQINGPDAKDKNQNYNSHADYFNGNKGENRRTKALEPAKRAMKNGWVRVREYSSAWHIQGFNLKMKSKKLRGIMDYLACDNPSSIEKPVNILNMKQGYYSDNGIEWDESVEQRRLPHL